MATSSANPRVDAVATVRNRRGLIAGVEPFDGDGGRLHLVQVEYKDDQLPLEEKLIWELEPRRSLLEPTALPQVAGTNPMPTEDFDALLRATRWTATSPYLDPDGAGPVDRLPVSSPFHGAVQVEDYQLVPLLKALRMPRRPKLRLRRPVSASGKAAATRRGNGGRRTDEMDGVLGSGKE